jgi:hypothetical protein
MHSQQLLLLTYLLCIPQFLQLNLIASFNCYIYRDNLILTEIVHDHFTYDGQLYNPDLLIIIIPHLSLNK